MRPTGFILAEFHEQQKPKQMPLAAIIQDILNRKAELKFTEEQLAFTLRMVIAARY